VMEDPGTPVTPPVLSPSPAFKVEESVKSTLLDAAKAKDEENLKEIKRQVDAYAKQHGLSGRLRTTIDERGLVINVLTDAVLFDSGEATLKQPAAMLSELARLVTRTGIANPVRIEGNTDNVPVSSGRFRSNWELSSARANAVLQFMLAHRVAPSRLSTVGYGSQRPLSSNATAAGRSQNRRVNLVLLRRTFR
jgi:chemotaxis protein MotB